MNFTSIKLGLEWLAGEPVRIRSRRQWWVVLGCGVATLVVALLKLREISRPLVQAKSLAELPAPSGDDKFGLDISVRKQIFAELAAAEPKARIESRRSFPGPDLAWSADDERGARERREIAALMVKYKVTMTQAYLVLDEGIRERWPGPDGQPLQATTTPLHPRRNYGF